MVLLTVKGTTHPDEFVVSAACSDIVSGLALRLVKIQNNRHRLRLQLMSVHELLEAAKKANNAAAVELEAFYKAVWARSRDPKAEVHDAEAHEAWVRFREMVKRIFPQDCLHKEGDDAAVTALHQKWDNPDIDEEYRLHIYHLRAVMDDRNHAHEWIPEEQAALFFCGKALDPASAIGVLCAGNDKSRVTVKLGKAGGAAPSKEPRINYDDQRLLRQRHVERAEEFKTLEDSELRDRVLKQTRAKAAQAAQAAVPVPGAAPAGVTIASSVRKHIFDTSSTTIRDADEEN